MTAASMPCQFVSFRVAEGLFGVDIRLVKEINPNTRITAVPRSGPTMRGLVNIRGQVVLVIDVSVALGRGSSEIGPSSHVVILKTLRELERSNVDMDDLDTHGLGDKPIGLLADRIDEVIAVERDAIKPAPTHMPEQERRYYVGVVNLGEGAEMLAVLAPGELVTTT